MSLNLKLRNKIWQIEGTVKLADGVKKRVRQSTGYPTTMKVQAEKELSDLLMDIVSGKVTSSRPDTVNDIAKLYLNKVDKDLSKASQYNLGQLTRDFGSKLIKELTLRELTEWYGEMEVKASSIRRHMVTVNAMLEYAEKQGVAGIPEWRLTKPIVDDARCRWLTEDERDDLIYHTDPAARGLLALFFFTGCRLAEGFRLRGRDLRDGQITVWSRKGRAKKKKIRQLPILPEVSCYMKASYSPSELLFPDPDGNEFTRQEFYKYFNEAVQGRHIEDFVAHDMRHTYASHLVQKGVNLVVLQQLLGHETLEMVKRYAHLAPNNLTEAAQVLSKSLGVGATPHTPKGVLTHITPHVEDSLVVAHHSNSVESLDKWRRRRDSNPRDDSSPTPLAGAGSETSDT